MSSWIRYYPVESYNGSLFGVSSNGGICGFGPRTTDFFSHKVESYLIMEGQVSTISGSRNTNNLISRTQTYN